MSDPSRGGERGQMLFAHDTEAALAAAADLVNTGRQAEEQLPDVAALDAFVERWQWTGDRTHDEAELDAVRALRQLVRHGGWDYHVHAAPADAPLADRMAVDAAMAFSEVIRLKALDRLRVCAAEDCEDVVVDASKNASRRFCDTSCANRTNVA